MGRPQSSTSHRSAPFTAANSHCSLRDSKSPSRTIWEPAALAVVRATGEWELLHQARFGEDAYTTPALVDGRIYLRTADACTASAASQTSTQTGAGCTPRNPVDASRDRRAS